MNEAFKLSSVVTQEMLMGCLDGIVDVIPVLLPVSIAYISIRKAWAFLMGGLHSA